MIDEQYEQIAFAKAATEEESFSVYGYGLTVAGLITAGAYLYRKKYSKS